MHMSMYAHVYMWVHACVCVHVWYEGVNVCVYMHVYIYMFVLHVYEHKSIVHMCTCGLYVHVCTCVCCVCAHGAQMHRVYGSQRSTLVSLLRHLRPFAGDSVSCWSRTSLQGPLPSRTRLSLFQETFLSYQKFLAKGQSSTTRLERILLLCPCAQSWLLPSLDSASFSRCADGDLGSRSDPEVSSYQRDTVQPPAVSA